MFYYFCKNFPVNKCFPILFRGPVYFLFMFTFRQIGNPVSCRLWLKNLIKENIYAALSISFVCSLSRRLEIQSLVAYDWRILLARTFILTLMFSYFKPYILKLVCFFGFYWYSILCKKKNLSGHAQSHYNVFRFGHYLGSITQLVCFNLNIVIVICCCWVCHIMYEGGKKCKELTLVFLNVFAFRKLGFHTDMYGLIIRVSVIIF
jgi:hypothetical protein